MTDVGSEFQTDCAAHRKTERFAKSVRANGWMSSGVAVERSVCKSGVNVFTCFIFRILSHQSLHLFM